jgi:hypothetical protein
MQGRILKNISLLSLKKGHFISNLSSVITAILMRHHYFLHIFCNIILA